MDFRGAQVPDSPRIEPTYENLQAVCPNCGMKYTGHLIARPSNRLDSKPSHADPSVQAAIQPRQLDVHRSVRDAAMGGLAFTERKE